MHPILHPDAFAWSGRVGDDRSGGVEFVESRLNGGGSEFDGVADGADGDPGVGADVTEDRGSDEVAEERDRVLSVGMI